MSLRIIFVLAAISVAGFAAEKYSGPMPPKSDVLYLLQANHLIETETGQAREESKKDATIYSITGAASPARTPLSEPIFIIDARQVAPDRMELYKLDVRNGSREVSLSNKGRKGGRPLHLMVTKLAEHLYKVEADEPLENGEYAISPSGENRVFCFQIY
jgi:hypothetical protein